MLAFPDALRAVALRGRLMAAAYPSGYGMAAVIGLPERRVAALVDQARAAGPLHLANRNAPLQTVVAGADAALDAALRARPAGRRPQGRAPLRARALALPAARARRPRARGGARRVRVAPPSLPYASGSRARLLADPDLIRADLAANVALPVRWHDTTVLLHERGVRLFLQAPPGTVLADLAAAAFPDARCLAIAASGLGSAAFLAQQAIGAAP